MIPTALAPLGKFRRLARQLALIGRESSKTTYSLATPPVMNTSSRERDGEAGFTLIELMVAITAGLFVATAAFALAKQGSKFFQQEARIANAQFSAQLGFDRLRADIARAGFLSTSNVQRERFLCPTNITPTTTNNNTAGWPAGMTGLAAVQIAAATPADAQDTTNGLTPDQITLSGSYASVEIFPMRGVWAENSKYQVYLESVCGAVARSGGIAGTTLTQIFKAGRMLRLLDSSGRYQFGAIESYAVSAAGEIVISLKQVPAVTFKLPTTDCGVVANGETMSANVINRIRYEIRDLSKAPPAAYKALYATSATAPGDTVRRELVRVELDYDGKEMADSLELISEYAVDLKFGLSAITAYKTTDGYDPTITQFPIGDSRVYDYAYEPNSSSPVNEKGPHRIRSIRARLAVRSREADRVASAAVPTSAPGGALFRYAIPGGGGYARVRSLVADIALPNLTGVSW